MPNQNLTDDERAARHLALKAQCPSTVIFYNIVLVTGAEGQKPDECPELRCAGHSTFEGAVECWELRRQGMLRWAKDTTQQAKAYLDSLLASGQIPAGAKAGIGEYRFGIVRVTHEFVEEQD